MTTCPAEATDANSFRTQYEPMEHDDISMTVVEAMATITETPAHKLEPLYKAIDPDALDRVVSSADRAVVEFDYCGHTVALDSDGQVLVLDN